MDSRYVSTGAIAAPGGTTAGGEGPQDLGSGEATGEGGEEGVSGVEGRGPGPVDETPLPIFYPEPSAILHASLRTPPDSDPAQYTALPFHLSLCGPRRPRAPCVLPSGADRSLARHSLPVPLLPFPHTLPFPVSSAVPWGWGRSGLLIHTPTLTPSSPSPYSHPYWSAHTSPRPFSSSVSGPHSQRTGYRTPRRQEWTQAAWP